MEFGIAAGLAVLGFCIYQGLNRIADAIRYRRTDVNFKDQIKVKVIHGGLEDPERPEAKPIIPQPQSWARK